MDGSLDTKKILKAIKNGELTAEEGLRLIDTKKADNISQNVEIAVEKGQNISKTDIGYIDTKVLKIKTVEYLKGVLSKDLDIPAH